MRNFLIIFILILSLIPANSIAQAAPPEAADLAAPPAGLPASSPAENSSGSEAVLCLPGVYLESPAGCLPLGPSTYITEMAQQGISLPVRPLAARPIDPSLGWLPFLYAELNEGENPIYASLDDAIAERNPVRMIGPGALKYVSYITYESTENGVIYQLKSGGWVRVRQKVGLPSGFRGGLEFSSTPRSVFGWILPLNPYVETKRTPGYQTRDYTGHQLAQNQVVQVYGSQVVDDLEWYQVAPGEWIEQRTIGRVLPNPTPPDGVTNGRWIEVNLFEQTLSVYDNSELVYATLIATGLDGFWTRPGLFPIERKLTSTPMSGAFELDRSDFYYLEDVPWTMYYDDARALHGAYWRHRLGYPQSHGCVNLNVADAQWLFNWAQEGDWVYVWDPSGRTPVDPNAYSPGGA